jgi:hypothetical protein
MARPACRRKPPEPARATANARPGTAPTDRAATAGVMESANRAPPGPATSPRHLAHRAEAQENAPATATRPTRRSVPSQPLPRVASMQPAPRRCFRVQGAATEVETARLPPPRLAPTSAAPRLAAPAPAASVTSSATRQASPSNATPQVSCRTSRRALREWSVRAQALVPARSQPRPAAPRAAPPVSTAPARPASPRCRQAAVPMVPNAPGDSASPPSAATSRNAPPDRPVPPAVAHARKEPRPAAVASPGISNGVPVHRRGAWR